MYRSLLDTHALVWWLTQPSRLTARARAELDRADDAMISAASAWELALLIAAERIALDRPLATWLHDASRQAGIRQLSIDAGVAMDAVDLGARGFRRDPADRFIYGTAARNQLVLVSKDVQMHRFASTDRSVEVIW